ncbi:hypothetical protein R7X45_03205 [Mesomycoplasma ovipneumoniae]|uniref:hypothetical protein n=1 Tax=Mesomycoplasma ovipneumoniae TaxID=29562 RepID=UPI002963EAE9|nr:hypothetical protein [Mesomycoplasma ovipneumoniae]MDW2926588.1 hypothetical protein [Mesomycoplasma ovipneumoniae]
MKITRHSVILNNYIKFSNSFFIRKDQKGIQILALLIISVVFLIIFAIGAGLLWDKNIWWVGPAAFWPLPFVWVYFVLGLFLRKKFVDYFDNNSILKSIKFLKLFLISRLSFGLLNKLRDENFEKYYKKANELANIDPSIVFYGSFAESMTFLKSDQINDVDFCSSSNLRYDLGAKKTTILDNKQITDPYDISIKSEEFSFIFVPKKYQTTVENLTITSPVYQIANKINKLVLLSNIKNLDQNYEIKFKNTIDDLKEISKFNLPFTKVKLSQCYFDAILQKSQYICVLNQDKILNNIQKIDLNLLIENFTENIELTLENPFSNYGKPFKISVLELIKELENDTKIKNLRLAFDNNFHKFFNDIILPDPHYKSDSPLLEFSSKDEFNAFKEKLEISNLSLNYLSPNLVFSYKNDRSIDIRHIFAIFIAEKFKELEENEK